MLTDEEQETTRDGDNDFVATSLGDNDFVSDFARWRWRFGTTTSQTREVRATKQWRTVLETKEPC